MLGAEASLACGGFKRGLQLRAEEGARTESSEEEGTDWALRGKADPTALEETEP